jgi:hypothetical protein
MSATVDVGTGASVTFSSGFFAEIANLDWSGITREAIETSHMGTAAPSAGEFGNKTFIPGDLSDPGSLDVELHFNPDTIPPIDGAAETVTLQFAASDGDTTGASWAGSGFLTDCGAAIPLEDKMTMSATIKFTGNITRVAGA